MLKILYDFKQFAGYSRSLVISFLKEYIEGLFDARPKLVATCVANGKIGIYHTF